jgi:iron-sulfur cluster repair protein YtfE (RIC family)
VASADFDAAGRAFATFAEELTRHDRLEEEVLFPLFEMKSGLVDGPTQLMREEHREIAQALTRMQRTLSEGDPQVFREALQFLRGLLRDHNAKEEHILYPAADSLLSPEQRAAFAERLRARRESHDDGHKTPPRRGLV